MLQKTTAFGSSSSWLVILALVLATGDHASIGVVTGFSTQSPLHPAHRSSFSHRDPTSYTGIGGPDANGRRMNHRTNRATTTITRRIESTSIHADRLRGWTGGRCSQHANRSSSSSRTFAASIAVPGEDDDDDGNSDAAAAASAVSTTDNSDSIIRDVWTRLVTGEERGSLYLRKPGWLSKSSRLSRVLPTWLFHLRPSAQLAVALVLYLFHTAVLTQKSLIFPFQVFPNDRGNFQSIGLDTLAGMGTLAFYQYLRGRPSNFFDLEVEETSKTSESVPINATAIYSNATDGSATTTVMTTTTTKTTTTSINASFLPDLWSAPNPKNMPWKNIWKSNYSRFSSFLALMALTRAYFFTGRFSLFWEDKLYEMARYWTWMTVPMHRSLTVLLGHLSWIAIGSLILRWIPRPQPFFQEPVSQWFQSRYRANPDEKLKVMPEPDDDTSTSNDDKKAITPGQLLEYSSQQSRHPQWVWWAVGGYFVSSWFFNMADFCNSYIFPVRILEQAEENSIVAKLVNPEGSDIIASLVGYIAPCLTAPWWEEVLYRGFLLPALVLQFGAQRYHLANFVSGVLFSIHHQSELAFLPLCVLGWTWAVVYTKSKNLWTTILIHCMWNSRIFLGGWFGL